MWCLAVVIKYCCIIIYYIQLTWSVASVSDYLQYNLIVVLRYIVNTETVEDNNYRKCDYTFVL